ncbi:MAG: energy-coupling factor ABC transporter permease [Bacteroidota bacterium]
MHMSDALLSPAVGGTMWAASAWVFAYATRKLRHDPEEARAPLMGVLGAFVFAAQMLNFAIPGTGSSGHLGGGLLLAVLLGSPAAFVVMAAILLIQALFFADGGLLAYGANLFNLGFLPCCIGYALIYRPIAGEKPTRFRLYAGSLAAAVIGLQLGALGVVVQTALSGFSDLPVKGFFLLMQPIHLAIGLVEGLITAAVLDFLRAAEPAVFIRGQASQARSVWRRPVVAVLLIAALSAGGVFAWFASTRPDGLEWSLARVTGQTETPAPAGGLHRILARIQQKIAILPDYAPRRAASHRTGETESPGPAARGGTSLAGLAGVAATLGAAALLGLILRLARKRPS